MIEQLLKPDSPLNDEQKQALSREVLENERKLQSIIDECNDSLSLAKGAILAAKAMITNQGGATHRMKQFYAESIAHYIDEVQKKIGYVTKDDDGLPF